jgi:hypothetical protein
MRPVRAQRLTLVMLVAAALSPGCAERVGGYLPISSLAKDGFARNGESVRQLNGRTVRVWGFVDDRNLYADSSAKPILGDWWSGEGPDTATWRLDLMARADDQAGHGLQVQVANDAGRDDLLLAFVGNAREGKPTQVFVEGRLFTFDAPTNAITLTGLYLKVGASQGVRLQPRE